MPLIPPLRIVSAGEELELAGTAAAVPEGGPLRHLETIRTSKSVEPAVFSAQQFHSEETEWSWSVSV